MGDNLMMEALYTSETSVYFDKTIWRYIPEGSRLQNVDIIFKFVVFSRNCWAYWFIPLFKIGKF
jgi:hypothetical protein